VVLAIKFLRTVSLENGPASESGTFSVGAFDFDRKLLADPVERGLMNDNKKKVVIVDDHLLFRECLAQLINAEPDLQVTGEAENTKDALQLIQNTSTDLAIVEITLKGLTELKLIKSLRRLFTPVPVLVLQGTKKRFTLRAYFVRVPAATSRNVEGL
jgi:CheY-like chemotaxis protein